MKKICNSLLINQEGFSEYNIPIERFYEKKPLGISGVARLKNAEDFLKLCLESHIPYLDELILVDNKSTDSTKDICLEFLQRYPDKVKYYEYPFDVHPYSRDNSSLSGNSVHSLAYYYNRCFSKSKYSHVMKVDDDNLLIEEKRKGIREESLKSDKYNIYYGVNLANDAKGNFGTVKGLEYLGYFGDHGIYPVSPYTYYLQGAKWEVFVNNKQYKRYGCALFHLKFLKPNFGFYNQNLTNSEMERVSGLFKVVENNNLKFLVGDSVDLMKYLKIIKNYHK